MKNVERKNPDRPCRATLNERDVGNAVLALTRELWVLADRMTVMEHVLEKRGIDIRHDIETFQPDAELQARLDARGQQIMAAVVNAMAGIVGAADDPP